MKISRSFIIAISVLLILMFALQLNLPQRYSWIPTFSHKDKNPFGCYVFDSIMSQSVPSGYSVTDKTLYRICHDGNKVNVLIISDDVNLSKTDVDAIKDIAGRGGNVLIAGNSKTYNTTSDSLMIKNFGACFKYGYFSITSLKRKIKNDASGSRDTIHWSMDNDVYKDNIYPVYSMMIEDLMTADSADNTEVIAFRTGDAQDKELRVSPVAIRKEVGKGSVILVSTPLLFTNYGILDGSTTEYIFRLMSHISNNHVVRTTSYMKTQDMADAEASPLRFFLGQPPLRTALYLALLVITLFLIFNARRRQRVIPVVEQPQNRSLEFVKLIGTLYYHNKDHSDIVRKKFAFFAEELRRLLMVDITDRDADRHSFSVISSRTGLRLEEVENIISDIRKVADRESNVTEYGVRLYIDNMNMIINKII
ncbi:MAG: DUF4350 domain-containing protein [Prevotella sp.]|nr:DUF4350 domain-containing protein [Prevotella sp.]